MTEWVSVTAEKTLTVTSVILQTNLTLTQIKNVVTLQTWTPPFTAISITEDQGVQFTLMLLASDGTALPTGATVDMVVSSGGAIVFTSSTTSTKAGLVSFIYTFANPGTYSISFSFAGMVVTD